MADPMAYLHAPFRHTAPVLLTQSLHLLGGYFSAAPGLDLPYWRFCHARHVGADGDMRRCTSPASHLSVCLPSTHISAAAQVRLAFRFSLEDVTAHFEKRLDAPLLVLLSSAGVAQRAVIVYLLDPASTCAPHAQAVPSCAHIVSTL
jgi:hypothetical protein